LSGTQTPNTTPRTLTLTGGSTLPSHGVLSLGGGTLNGAGNLNVSGTLNWSNGIMSGGGLTTVAAGATFTLAGGQPRLERTLNNSANVVLTSTSSFFINGGTFNNQSGAVFDIQANVGIFDSTPGTFNNGGTLRKSAGTATSTISLPLNNTGTVEVQTGTLNFSSGGTHSGPFSASNGATLQFGGGTHTLAATASVNAPSS